MTNTNLIKQYMEKLGCTEAEARDLIAYDNEVDHNRPTTYDLTPEQKKVAKQYTKVDSKKPTVYKFTKRERKANLTKSGIISQLADFLTEQGYAMVEITNKERQIAFKVDDNSFELTLVQKRKPKQ